ncbi:MAG: sarcosine oxidase subunit delta [Roseiarcus sp.]
MRASRSFRRSRTRAKRPPEGGICKSSPARSAVRATKPNSTISANRRRGPGPAGSVSDAEWANYLWFNANPKGEAREIWLHLTCMEMFAMTRDTATNAVIGSEALTRAAS